MVRGVIWLALCCLFILLELTSPGLFFFLGFFFGALAAAFFALFGTGILIEIAVFFIVSLVSFFLLSRYVKLTGKDTLYKTNVYALIGKKAFVAEVVSKYKKGWIKLDGEVWPALALEDEIIEKESLVVVVSVVGSHLIIKRYDE